MSRKAAKTKNFNSLANMRLCETRFFQVDRSMTEQRFILRLLPMPAKLVLAVFLLAVGLGYFSALVQLHLQHSSRSGEPLPSAADVVEVFAGVRRYDPATAVEPVCK